MIVGDFRVQHAADGEGGVGVGVVEHHIDAPSAGGRGTFVIHMYPACVGGDGDSAADVYDFAVRQIQLGGGFVGACREVADAGAGGLFGADDYLVREVFKVVQAVLFQQGQKTLRADFARCHLSVKVALHVVGLAHIGEHEIPHILIAFALSHELADGYPETFLKHIPRPCADAVAAHIGVMNGGAEKGDGSAGSVWAVFEHGIQHGHIQQLTCCEIRVVGDEHIAGG